MTSVLIYTLKLKRVSRKQYSDIDKRNIFTIYSFLLYLTKDIKQLFSNSSKRHKPNLIDAFNEEGKTTRSTIPIYTLAICSKNCLHFSG